jgi:DNA-binding XRE family transcriptional regulator
LGTYRYCQNLSTVSNLGHMSTQPDTTHIPQWTAGDRFRKAREDAGLTQQELADELSVDRNTVSAYESDQRKRPMRSVVKAWAMRCGVPAEWLTTGGGSSTGGKTAPAPRQRYRPLALVA